MTNRGPERKWVPLVLRRVFAHITRATAITAWLIAILCAVVYQFVPFEQIPGIDLVFVDTVLLTLFSLALGAVFLPGLPSNLWSIDVEKVRNLIPEAKRNKLAQSLIKAESYDDRWTDLVWDSALEPLIEASRKPWTYVWDMDYEATVHVGRSIELGSRSVPVSTVTVENKSGRFLANPGVSSRWLSMSRTVEALKDEYDLPGCLAREVAFVPGVSQAEWHEYVSPKCHASVMIDGVDIPLRREVSESSPDVIRWYLSDAVDIPTDRSKVVIHFEFPMDSREEMFMVSFSGYYVAGVVDVGLKLFNAEEGTTLDADHFIGKALHNDWKPYKRNETTDVCLTSRYSTGHSTILWPGSGVNFYWKQPRP